MEPDPRGRELSAWSAHLRLQGERLAVEIALLLGRLADTEEHVARAFTRRAMATPQRADMLWHYAWQAQVSAERLRNKQSQSGMPRSPSRTPVPGSLRGRAQKLIRDHARDRSVQSDAAPVGRGGITSSISRLPVHKTSRTVRFANVLVHGEAMPITLCSRGVIDARTHVEHRMSVQSAAAHRHAGCYVAHCGATVLAASLTEPGHVRCAECAR